VLANGAARQFIDRHDAGGRRIYEAEGDNGDENSGGKVKQETRGAPAPRMSMASLGALPWALACYSLNRHDLALYLPVAALINVVLG
jgi:hypothetical protein